MIWLLAMIYVLGLLLGLVMAFFDDSGDSSDIVLGAFLWPVIIVFAALILVISIPAKAFGKWRSGVLKRLREKRLAKEGKLQPVRRTIKEG